MKSPLDRFRMYFEFAHLPPRLGDASAPFWKLADFLIENYDPKKHDLAETEMALRKLLEAKDCAVRAVMGKP